MQCINHRIQTGPAEERRLNICKWCPLRTWGGIFPNSRDSITTRDEFESFHRVGDRKEWYWLFLVENPICRGFTTAQLNKINHLHPRYEPQTGYNLSDVRITTTDNFKILFSFSLETHSQPNSSRGPLHNHLTIYLCNLLPPKLKSPTKKQEDFRPSATASRCEGTVEIPA